MSTPIVADTARVYEYAQSVITQLNDAAVELLVDLPTKQYVTSGEAAFDCEQVAVAGVSLTTGMPGADSQSIGVPVPIDCMPVWSVNFDVTIVRCGPKVLRNGTVTAEELNASFQRASADIAVFMLTLEKILADRVFGSIVASISMAPPQGEMVATVMTITAALP